jgi:general secretion pathway protein G
MNFNFEKTKGTRRGGAGFTLLELMIVISIIFILMGMAAGNYRNSVQRAREASLHSDLKTMRDAIDNYTLDRLSPPQSLDDLKSGGYLREVPTDPMTQQKDWVPDYGDSVLTPDQNGSGITDVHSASTAVSKFEGTAYNTW